MNEINETQRDSLLQELAQLDGVIAGSFFSRQMNGSARFCLSSMKNGKQRQRYVAAKHADSVKQGVEQYARALEILSELGSINLARIKKGNKNA